MRLLAWPKGGKVFFWLIAIGLGVISAYFYKNDIYSVVSSGVWLVAILSWLVANLFGIRFSFDAKNWKWLVFLLIFSLAIRAVYIDQMPSGLWHDEIEANVAGQVMLDSLVRDKVFNPYTTDATGHPAISMLLSGVSAMFWGNSVLGVRWPSIVFGSLSIVIFFKLIALFFEFRVALAVSLMMAVSYWHLSLSRLGFEATFFWFFQIGSLYWLAKYYKTNRAENLGWAGATLGVGLYSYLAFRSWLLIMVIVSLVAIAYINRKEVLKLIAESFRFIFPLVLIILPLFFYGRHFPDKVWSRSADLSIFNKKFDLINRPEMILQNSWKTVGMLFWQGDPNLRHNPQGRPALDPLIGGLFVGGMVVLIRKKYYLWGLLVLMGLGAMGANGIFTYEPPYITQPHSLRTLGMLPIVMMVVAMMIDKISGRWKYGVTFGLVALVWVINLGIYFGPNQNAGYSEAFQTKQTMVAKQLNIWCGKNPFISTSLIDPIHINFLAKGCSYQKFVSGEVKLNDYYILAENEAPEGCEMVSDKIKVF